MKKILVVGGAGFIGSCVNKQLADGGFQTVVLDNLSRGSRSSVCRGQLIEGDLGDGALLDQLFSTHPIEAVMHFAAFTDVGESIASPHLYYQNNVVKTLTLLEAMRQHKVDKLVFSSSAAVYGLPQQELIDESHPCTPINPYGETKLMVEKILHTYHLAYGLKVCSLRYFNAAGGDPDGELKHRHPNPSNLIPIILNRLAKGIPVTLFGTDYPTPDRSCVRDYIHIHDLGRAHLLALQQLEERSFSFYNLGNGHGYSVREVISAVEKATGKKVKVVEGARRPGDPPYLIAKAEKAKQELLWQPRYSLDEMVSHAWANSIA
jgi:UDP-glucose 4-epimerase